MPHNQSEKLRCTLESMHSCLRLHSRHVPALADDMIFAEVHRGKVLASLQDSLPAISAYNATITLVL